MRAGFGRASLEGHVPGMRLLGWADPDNRLETVAEPLAVRAVALGDGERTVVFACGELCFISQALRAAVVRRVQPLGISPHDLMLTATHNHSGPGGLSHHLLYTLIGRGFAPEVVEQLADGIAEAVGQAVRALEPARLTMARGSVTEPVAWNRALPAWRRNRGARPVQDGASALATDRCMHLLQVRAVDGRPMGLVCWFGLHGTTVHGDHTALRFDHKGLASRLVEGEAPEGAERFVAIFAQAPCGDITPNPWWDGRRGRAVLAEDDLVARERVARAQVRVARRLWSAEGEAVEGPVDGAIRYLDVQDRPVDADLACPGARTTAAVVGVGLGLGTDEGPGPSHHSPGAIRLATAFGHLAGRLPGRFRHGHRPKTTLLQAGRGASGRLLGMIPVKHLSFARAVDPGLAYGARASREGLGDFPWVPVRLPLQILRVGPLALAGLPCEPTTTAGRRLAGTLARSLEGEGVRFALVQPLANAYASYCVTPEEYDEQHYEAAATLYGRWTLAMWRTELRRLAVDLLAGRARAAVRPPQPPTARGIAAMPVEVDDESPSARWFSARGRP